jgi:hypothetical protein
LQRGEKTMPSFDLFGFKFFFFSNEFAAGDILEPVHIYVTVI